MSFDLLLIARKRILDMFKKVKSGLWKILVVDNFTTKILNSCFTKSEILEKNISMIERLESVTRQKFPQVEAIYFIRPIMDSLRLLIDDFSRKKKKYSKAHVFFTSHIRTSLVEKIKRCNLSNFLQNFVELNLDFIPQEKCVFTIHCKDDYKKLLGNTKPTKEEIEKLSAGLSTFLLTIEEKPSDIRYDRKSVTCSSIAERLLKLLNNSKTHHKSTGAVLLIVDRLIDLNSPLLHTFTYQTMLLDVLDIGIDHKVKNYVNEGLTTLNHRDPLWSSYRHKYLFEAALVHRKYIKKWAKENRDIEEREGIDRQKIAKILHKFPKYKKENQLIHLHSSLMKSIKEKVDENNIFKLTVLEQDIVTGNEFNDTSNTFSKMKKPLRHLKVNGLLGDRYSSGDKLRLLILFLVNYGQKYNTMNKKKEKELKKAIRMSNIISSSKKAENSQLLNNFKKFLLEPYFERMKTMSRSDDNFGLKMKKFVGGALKMLLLREKEEMVVSRYVNHLSVITKNLVNGKLSEVEFPYFHLDEELHDQKLQKRIIIKFSSDPKSQNEPKSSSSKRQNGHLQKRKKTRTTKTKTSKKESSEEDSERRKRRERNKKRRMDRRMKRRRRSIEVRSDSEEEEEEEGEDGDEDDNHDEKKTENNKMSIKEGGNKLFVFCVGGVTFSEIRDFYGLLKKKGISGAIGGTSLLTGNVFLGKVLEMEGKIK